MEKARYTKFGPSGLGSLLNRIQTLFVGMLRVWSIPIVLMLSISSGFTTYYGLSYFILPWIALIITIAIQSIIVICSLEIASIHWQANRGRYLSVILSLLVAITASITFSYFKFYEVSQAETIRIDRINVLRQDVNGYLSNIVTVKSAILKQKHADLDKLAAEVSQAYFGTHEQVPDAYKNIVGEGPFWKHYNQRYQTEKTEFEQLDKDFHQIDEHIRSLQTSLNHLSVDTEKNFQLLTSELQEVQLKFNELATNAGYTVPESPILMTYAQFVQGVTPSFAMWNDFSLFAFACAAMVDFFTFLLSYRLETTAPGPLTEEEQELAFQCLREFSEFRINNNDELEIVIEKTAIEKARHYSDWSRMFAVGFVLSRGFLRKIDKRSVEFAPNLYPLMSERMSAQIQELKNQANLAKAAVKEVDDE